MEKHETNLEIEYKFNAADLTLESLQDRINSCLDKKVESIYVVSCDDYYIKKETDGFLRYRKDNINKELTLKIKRMNNTVRKEINLDLSNSNGASIVEFLSLSGYKKIFSVFKEAWVWNLNDCIASYYTLSDGRSYIEIEAHDPWNQEEGIYIINTWAEKLGLNINNIEKRSLFEIFTNEIN